VSLERRVVVGLGSLHKVKRSAIWRLMEQQSRGFTVGDGFRFGCGFTLALAVGVLAALIVLTAFVTIGVLLGIKIPVFG